MTQLLHPPYLPDLAPCDFFLFPWMKNVLKGKVLRTCKRWKKRRRRH
jgi:hypothetical protein